MNKQTKTVYLLVYIIVFICTMILTSNDVSKLTGGLLLSILFGVGGTVIDRDITRMKQQEKNRELINRLAKPIKKTRANYN